MRKFPPPGQQHLDQLPLWNSPQVKTTWTFASRKLLLNNSPWTTTPQTIVPMKFLPGQLPPELLPPNNYFWKVFPRTITPKQLHPLNSSQDIVPPGQLPPDNCPSPLKFFPRQFTTGLLTHEYFSLNNSPWTTNHRRLLQMKFHEKHCLHQV